MKNILLLIVLNFLLLIVCSCIDNQTKKNNHLLRNNEIYFVLTGYTTYHYTAPKGLEHEGDYNIIVGEFQVVNLTNDTLMLKMKNTSIQTNLDFVYYKLNGSNITYDLRLLNRSSKHFVLPNSKEKISLIVRRFVFGDSFNEVKNKDYFFKKHKSKLIFKDETFQNKKINYFHVKNLEYKFYFNDTLVDENSEKFYKDINPSNQPPPKDYN